MVRLKGKVRLITLQTWLWFFIGAEAHAGYSLDVELLRSTLAAGTPPGVDSPLIAGQGSVRVGAVYQYERDPVILYKFNEEVGALVVNRTRDGGKSFETLRAGLPQKDAYDLVYRHGLDVSADGQSLLMGSTTGGLWASSDGGDHWQTVSLNLPPIAAVRFG